MYKIKERKKEQSAGIKTFVPWAIEQIVMDDVSTFTFHSIQSTNIVDRDQY